MKVLFVVLFTLLLLQVATAKEKILLIESYHSTYAWDASYIEGLELALDNEYELIKFEMNTKRLPKSEYQKMADLAYDKFMEVSPSLVILADDNALSYLGSKFFDTDTPVVYLGINNNPRNYGVVGRNNFTGVLERPLFKRSIANVQKLQKLNKVLVLFDDGNTAKVVHESAFIGETSAYFLDVKADIKLVKTFDEWKSLVKSAKGNYDAVFVGLYFTIKDNEGNNVDANEIIKWTSENIEVPPYAFWDFAVGDNKTIGGYVLFGAEQGRIAGELAIKMLNNKNKELIPPITPDHGKLLFDRKQLKKWNITLPAHLEKKALFTK